VQLVIRAKERAGPCCLPVCIEGDNMKTTMTRWATKAAGAGAIALLLATPAFAQSRGDRNQDQNQRRDTRDSRDSRDNQRVTASGKISSFSHERDGYRVRLDNDNRSYWVPQSAFGNRARDLRAGISIGLGGVFRGGSIYVDAVSWPNDGYGYGNRAGGGYDNGFVRGVVERVDVRDGTLRVREARTGRIITADLAGGRYGRSELRGLRRGDFVELSGQWIRGGVFDVARIERR
jgi:hypothetical protein